MEVDSFYYAVGMLCIVGAFAMIIAVLEWFSPSPPQWVVNVKMWWRYRK